MIQTGYGTTRSTACDQFIGAAAGGLIGVGVVATTGQHLPSYAAAVVVVMTLCWLLNVGSAARLSGTTATIIMLVPHTGSPERTMLARLFEVGWGLTVALVVVGVVSRMGLTAMTRRLGKSSAPR